MIIRDNLSKLKNKILGKSEEIIPPKDYQSFYMQGHKLGRFPKSETYKRFFSKLKEVGNHQVQEPFRMEQKYKGSLDLRPNVYSFDPSFIDILTENNLHNEISRLAGTNLTLAHIQLRQAKKSKQSYINWHRDTHFYKDENVVGNTPPLYKLIFYPNFEESSPCLDLLSGSHLRFHDTLKEDLKFKNKNENNIITLNSSENEYLIFNTSLFHKALAPQAKNGNLRLIYIFCHPSQLHMFPEEKELHELYLKKTNNE